MSKSKYSPTKADLWDAFCESVEAQRRFSEETTRVIAENTQSIRALHSVVSNLQNTLDAATQQIMKGQNGVPVPVFLMIVAVLIIVILAVTGLRAADLLPLIQ